MLQKALIAVWQEKGNKAEMTDIADWLLARKEPYAHKLGNKYVASIYVPRTVWQVF